jgi:hypothetical protein
LQRAEALARMDAAESAFEMPDVLAVTVLGFEDRATEFSAVSMVTISSLAGFQVVKACG